MTAPPLLSPGAQGQQDGRWSRLLYSWEAEDGTLRPRTRQPGTFTAGGGVGTPWLRGMNGLFLQSPLQPRFEVGDSDYDGVLDDRTSLLLEPSIVNLVENASAELDLAGLTGAAAGVVTRETGQDLHYPGATAIGVAGTAIGDGVNALKRDGAQIATSVTNHAVIGWVKPNAATVGRALKLQLEFRDNASPLGTVEFTTPVLRSGWQRIAQFVASSTVPVGTTKVIARVVLASAAAGQAFSLAGWTLATGQAAVGSPVFTSTGQITRQPDEYFSTYTRPVQPCSILVTARLEVPLLPSALAANTQPYGLLGIGGSSDTGGGWLNIQWTGAGWTVGRSVGGVAAATATVATPDTMAGWVDILAWLHTDGGLQLGGIRGLVNGVLTEAPGSAKTGAQPTHITRQAWSANRLDRGAGQGGLNRGPWRLYAIKMAAGAGKTFTQIDGLI